MSPAEFKKQMQYIDNLMTLWAINNDTGQRRPEIEDQIREMGFTVHVDGQGEDAILLVKKEREHNGREH